MWCWLRFLVVLVTGVVVIVLAGTIWLLSSDRYQTLLTEYLSQVLGAEVRVSGSRLSYTDGLGIEFADVTMQFPTQQSPFFSTERLAVLLDLQALVYGRLLFHELKASRPHIRIAGEEGEVMTHVLSLLAATEKTVAKSDTPGWFVLTLAVRHVAISEGSVTYVQKTPIAPLLVSQLQLLL